MRHFSSKLLLQFPLTSLFYSIICVRQIPCYKV
jgi:hypothetical protein